MNISGNKTLSESVYPALVVIFAALVCFWPFYKILMAKPDPKKVWAAKERESARELESLKQKYDSLGDDRKEDFLIDALSDEAEYDEEHVWSLARQAIQQHREFDEASD